MLKGKKEKIDTIILSDIHLGDQTVRCREILNIFEKYNPNRIVLNGDILNGLRFKRLHSCDWRVLSVFRKLSKSREVIWVHGNHDADARIISNLLGIKSCNKYIWEDNGKKYLALHGHQFDRFLNNNFITSQGLFAIYNYFKRNNVTNIFLEYIRKNNSTWKRNSEEVAKGAIRFARIMGADFVFCGHIHQIEEIKEKNIVYYNTGSWSEGVSGYITINNGKVVLNKV